MERYFQSQPVFSAPIGGIDREAGIIHGITIARIGPAKGHDGFIDKTFLMQVVEMAATRPQGIKARFGHPNMCSNALGTYLGRFHNYSLNDNAVTADLHLDQSAKTSPNGNLFEYVLNMAESNPDMFGASLVFESASFLIVENKIDGKTTKVKNFRLKVLRATDIVDEPAATDGLFSADSMPALATQFLDENPSLADFIFSKPESVIEFFNNYLNNSSMNLPEKIKCNFRKLFSLDAEQLQIVETPTEPTDEHPVDTELTQIVESPVITDKHDQQLLFDETLKSLDEALAKLNELTSENSLLKSQLAARPTLPKQVTDPQVSVHLNDPVKDETGKQMLSNIPPDLKHKLRNVKPQNNQNFSTPKPLNS